MLHPDDHSVLRDNVTRDTFSLSRGDLFERLRTTKRFDVAIIGGGIHGACAARLAAFNGLSTVLFERTDYGAETSSRTSKMAHGGLRYLELFDFAQVFEGIRARENLFEVAPHLCTPKQFLIPIPKQQTLFRYKMGVGLWLYDLFVTKRERRHRWIPKKQLHYESFNEQSDDIQGCFSYCDGIIRDTRHTIETIIAARQEGALCFNHTEVLSCDRQGGEALTLGVRDRVSDLRYEVRAGAVINCAGPWAPFVGRINADPELPVRYSRGIHLLFNRPWNDPPIFMPLPGKARYYWVWPHFSGTLVGTTESEVEAPSFDPQPTAAEIDEVLARVAKDLPRAGLTRENIHYAYAGIRTLPLRNKTTKNGVPQLSRRQRWVERDGIFSLLGGKYTTAEETAYQGVSLLLKRAEIKEPLVALTGRKLSGAGLTEAEEREWREVGLTKGARVAQLTRVIERFGRRALKMNEWPDSFESVGDVLKGELYLACFHEQAVTLEDIMRRRLELEYYPGNGMENLDQIGEFLCAHGTECDQEKIEQQKEQYRTRIAALKNVMASS